MSALKTNLIICGIFGLLFLFACQQEKPSLSSLFTPLSARAQYEQSLKKDTLFGKNRLSQWDSIGNLAYSHNVAIPTPFRQSGHFLKGRAEILAFEIPLKKGEIIDIQLNSDSTNIEIFMDFFQKKRGRWYPVFKNKKEQKNFRYEIPSSETFLLRIQPEFHKSGNYELKILKNPLYIFPVAGKGNEAVWSFWGDPRGGGKRKHKGIDIFAKRGTSLIAVCNGYISNVSDRGLGGKQVWIRDLKNNNMLYYAHLHKQLVKEGQTVQVGDTIGLVGNTGNAKATRPHLHFGIYLYRRGATDPLPFVKTYKNRFSNHLAMIKPDILNQGITLPNTNFRSNPSIKKSFLKKLKKGSPVELLGVAGRWYHVRTLEGEVGFIHYKSVKQLKIMALS